MLEAGSARHAVTQRANLFAADIDGVHGEELHVRDRAAVQLVQHLLGVRTLHLEAVVTAVDRLALRIARRAVVTDHVDLEAAGLAVELDPVHRRGAADEQQLVLVEIEQDAVADDVAVMADRHHLLRLVHLEVVEAVDRGVRDQLQRVGPLDGQFRHVVRLIRTAPRSRARRAAHPSSLWNSPDTTG